MLDKGQIVERGSHTELLDQGGYYAYMWAQQSAARDEGEDAPGAKTAPGLEALDGTQTGVARNDTGVPAPDEEDESDKQAPAPVPENGAAAGVVDAADVSTNMSQSKEG